MGSDELRGKILSILDRAYDNINRQLDWDVADAVIDDMVAPLLAEKDAELDDIRTELDQCRAVLEQTRTNLAVPKSRALSIYAREMRGELDAMAVRLDNTERVADWFQQVFQNPDGDGYYDGEGGRVHAERDAQNLLTYLKGGA